MAVAFFIGTKVSESMERLMVILMVCLSVAGLAGCKAHKSSKAEDEEATEIASWVAINTAVNSITTMNNITTSPTVVP